MKNYLISLILLGSPTACSFSQPSTPDNSPQTIITWNIRNNNPGDGVNSWPNRKEKVFSFLRKENPHLLCMQEVLDNQMKDIAKALPQYSWFGVGRDNGKEAGEYVPIFYLKEKYRMLKGDHFWLSENPAHAGKPAWDAACTRMVTWISLINKKTTDTLFVFNTHFDHIGVTARLMSAKMLSQAADSLAGNHAVVITGDFNSTPSDTPYQVITSAGFKDARTVSASAPTGPEYTFTGFDIKGKPGNRIDFIFVRNTKTVQNYIVRDDSSNGFYLSDHLPVLVGW